MERKCTTDILTESAQSIEGHQRQKMQQNEPERRNALAVSVVELNQQRMYCHPPQRTCILISWKMPTYIIPHNVRSIQKLD